MIQNFKRLLKGVMFAQQGMQLFVSQMISVLYAYNKIHYLQQTIKPPSKKLGYRVPIQTITDSVGIVKITSVGTRSLKITFL
nr:pl12R [African swine fever virus]